MIDIFVLSNYIMSCLYKDYIKQCNNKKTWFSDACTYHKCSKWYCGNMVSNKNSVKCRIHNKCQYENCNIYTLDQNVCHNHSYKKCSRVGEIGKKHVLYAKVKFMKF